MGVFNQAFVAFEVNIPIRNLSNFFHRVKVTLPYPTSLDKYSTDRILKFSIGKYPLDGLDSILVEKVFWRLLWQLMNAANAEWPLTFPVQNVMHH